MECYSGPLFYLRSLGALLLSSAANLTIQRSHSRPVWWVLLRINCCQKGVILFIVSSLLLFGVCPLQRLLALPRLVPLLFHNQDPQLLVQTITALAHLLPGVKINKGRDAIYERLLVLLRDTSQIHLQRVILKLFVLLISAQDPNTVSSPPFACLMELDFELNLYFCQLLAFQYDPRIRTSARLKSLSPHW